MFGLTTRGQLPEAVQLEFERLYARLTEFLSVSFDEDGTLLETAPDTRLVGEVIDYAGPTAPDKWLICDGSQVNRVTYKSLFETIGTTYGVGDGSTTFNLPDARGRFSLTKAVAGTGAVLGETGGSLDHTHSVSGVSISGTTSSNGDHSHSVSGSTSSDGSHAHAQGAHSHALITVASADAAPNSPFGSVAGTSSQTDIFNDSGTGSAGSHSHSFSGSSNTTGSHTHTFSGSTGSGTSGTANPAYIVFNKIIYTGVSA